MAMAHIKGTFLNFATLICYLSIKFKVKLYIYIFINMQYINGFYYIVFKRINKLRKIILYKIISKINKLKYQFESVSHK